MVSNHSARAAGAGRVPPTRPFIRALPRDTLVTRVAHCRHTNGTPTRAARGNRARVHASETRAEGEEDDDDDDEERRGGSGDGGRGRLRCYM